jgi:hypothetical protein
MVSDVPRLRYVLPKFARGYTASMKTLASSLKFAESDPAQFRLHVLEHGRKYGTASAIAAFGISRRTYFNWKKKLSGSRGKLSSLIPRRTCPERTRTMIVDQRIVEFIREIREEYGRVGKHKLKVLVDAYAASLGIQSYGVTKLHKIVKRHHFFFDPPKKVRKLRFQRERVKYAPKIKTPGYVELDSVHVMMEHTKLVFITIIDLATRVAYAERVRSATSQAAVQVFTHFQQLHNITVHTVQTDNGSEFLGDFHEHLEKQQIKHCFSYPRSPKINGMIERFNRTFQEEHVERTIEWWCDPEVATEKLKKYLQWYNGTRPHASLGLTPPLVYLQTFA